MKKRFMLNKIQMKSYFNLLIDNNYINTKDILHIEMLINLNALMLNVLISHKVEHSFFLKKDNILNIFRQDILIICWIIITVII